MKHNAMPGPEPCCHPKHFTGTLPAPLLSWLQEVRLQCSTACRKDEDRAPAAAAARPCTPGRHDVEAGIAAGGEQAAEAQSSTPVLLSPQGLALSCYTRLD